MKVKFCLIASLLILSLAISSHVVLAQSTNLTIERKKESKKIFKLIRKHAPRSKSPPDRQWGESDSPQAASPNSV
ncbi:unnamed protein product [Arabidopsis halleri]